ncbi:MAG: helix-turn-helix transcriptional regulator [Anaerolineae bacterium]|nr:helix-turn-helix transcriptional regulator [Anaerolineae bacterium]
MPDSAITPGRGQKRPRPFFLSKRQAEALKLAAGGRTAKQIGMEMGICPRTASAHLQAARRQLRAANTTHAVAMAITMGFIYVDSDFWGVEPARTAPAQG